MNYSRRRKEREHIKSHKAETLVVEQVKDEVCEKKSQKGLKATVSK